MTETPGTPDGDSADSESAESAAERPSSDESARPTWEAPQESARHEADDERPSADYPGAGQLSRAEGDSPRPPVGAPPLPGETPEPLAAQQTLPEPHVGAHRAPASREHAAYAGANSAAFTSLDTEPPAGGAEAPADGQAYAAGAATAPSAWATSSSPRPRRRGLGAFIAVAVVAAVIGALVATGGYAALGGRSASQSAGAPSNLTVNDYKDATIVTAVAAKATPSVVTINVSSGSSAGTGSGVVLTDDGYIVTNTHVVTLDGASGSGTVSVTTSTGRIYSGKIIGTDPLVDLAVIKIDATGLQPMAFADSSKINVGDTAVAIGAPLGLSNTVTDGIISTLNRSITVASSAAPKDGDSGSGSQDDNNGQGPFNFDNGSGSASSPTATIALPVIQTDASINPGNSGGALLDSKGRLVGLNVAIASSGSSSGSIGVGFAVPSNLVDRVSKAIIKSGAATHGQLGASVADATSDTKATQTGAVIKSLVSGGAAQAAGLRAGDVVTKFAGVSVTDATDLTAQVRVLAGGASSSLTYVRDGQTKTAKVTLGTWKG